MVNWSIHPNDEVDRDLSDLFSEEANSFSGIFSGEKYLLLQAPAQSEIPRGQHIHQWDVIMHNVSNVLTRANILSVVKTFYKTNGILGYCQQ